MKSQIILDTGPLVAFLNRRDKYHKWAVEQFGTITPPLLTCESVLSEATFLLNNPLKAGEGVLDLLDRGVITVPFQLSKHVKSISRLQKKYSDVPMSLADACLVKMAEMFPESSVFTLDSDFLIYRKNSRRTIPSLMPKNL